MAVTIDYGNTWVINIPQADLTLVSGTLYELDTDWFRQQLKDIEDSADGIAFPKTHNHNTAVSVAGVTFARIIEILPPYSVQFENGSYSVRLAGSNNNIFDVENGILVQNNVQVIANNSAGLISISDFREEARNAAYRSQVVVNTATGTSGTTYPIGLHSDPVDNLTDAKTILSRIGGETIIVESVLTLDQDLDGYVIEGATGERVDKVVINSNSIDNSQFRNILLSGTGTGPNKISADKCRLESLDGISGTFRYCGLLDSMTLNATDPVVLAHCYSEIPGTNKPTINCGGVAVDLSLRGWTGGIILTNVSNASADVTIDLLSGSPTLAASCTSGTIVIRGTGYVVDNSAGATVVTEGLVPDDDIELIRALVGNNVTTTGTGPWTVTAYEPDGVTVLATYTISADKKTRTRTS